MTPSSYPTDSTPPNLTPQMFTNWWNGNWQWALPVIIVVGLILLAIIVLMYASTWKIFKKAGKPGWAALIPFYSQYVFLEVIARPIWMFWVWLGFIIADSFLPFIGVVGGVVIFVFTIIWALDLAKVFGQSTGFGVANVFFPFVTYPILAFDKKITYVGQEKTNLAEVANDATNQNENSVTSNTSGAPKAKTHTGLVVALVIMIPVIIIFFGIVAAVIVGLVATNSQGSAKNTCSIAYSKNIEYAVDSYKSDHGQYPTSLDSLTQSQLDKSQYDFCSSNVTYTSDGKTYTIHSNLDKYTGSEPNIKNGIYSVSK